MATTIYTVGGQSEVPLALPNATLRGSSDERNPPVGKRRRRNRWSETREAAVGPHMPLTLPGNLGNEKTSALLKRVRIDEITARVTQPQPMTLHDTETRSPSPPPEYDRDGKRTNTRDQRVRHRLLVERQRLIEAAREENPLFRPPPDFKSMSLKHHRKLFIPLKDYPNYNFIGLIIGPRGMTQKQMERDTGAKISIRGRGSSTRGRMNSQPGDDEELHVMITADTRAQLQKASALVEKLLTPIDETKNLHKQLQLRTLAQINGTLRDNMWGENEEVTAGYAANVRCAICNDPSHVTSDCTQAGKPGARPTPGASAAPALDDEYSKFLSSIGETAPAPNPTPPAPVQTPAQDAESTYAAFLASIGEAPAAAPSQQQPSNTAAAPPPWEVGSSNNSSAPPPPWLQ
mmetsp:Transcript_4245/g.12967  ORF Transcript_4245/g.12967 Transcript_4245/m.12967 type:complete len:404 (+) Transcript_4245:78-1289(+)